MQPIQTKFSIRGQVNRMTMFREFWARSAHFGQNGGLGRVPQSRSFFCVVIQMTFRQLRNGRLSPNLATKRNSVSRWWILKDIFENFYFRGHLPLKSEIASRSNRCLTQSKLQVTGCTAERYCLLCIVQSREFPKCGQLFCTMYGCRATECQNCQIFGFLPIIPIHNA